MTSVAVHGVGATGARAARYLSTVAGVDRLVLSGTGTRPATLARSLGAMAEVAGEEPARADALVLAGPARTQLDHARAAIDAGTHVVSTSDNLQEVRALASLDARARAAGVSLVLGAGLAPGLTCILARHLGSWMDRVDEVHVARFGTGGPACARQHHDALSGRALDWRDGEWFHRQGGSGRELVVFPDPVGSIDCYRAALPDALLLEPAFPGVERITARQAANRRQRLTAWLPMMRKPHPEGRLGAVRVEVRGFKDGISVTEIAGAIDRPAVAAGAVAGVAARWALEGRLTVGAHGLASHDDTVPLLAELSNLGIRAAVFAGAD